MTQDEIRDISVAVYKLRLEDRNEGAVARMLAEDRKRNPNDTGERLRERAGSYDPMTRAYLKVLAICIALVAFIPRPGCTGRALIHNPEYRACAGIHVLLAPGVVTYDAVRRM